MRRESLLPIFFMKGLRYQKKITHAINSDESLGDEISRETSNAIIRQVMFGISINPRIARYIGKWFNARADEYERAVERYQGGSERG